MRNMLAAVISRIGGVLVLLATLAECSGPRLPPSGPPPEYERPEVVPWDAGRPPDPLSNLEELEGEWVDGPADAASQSSSEDAAVSDAKATDSDAAATGEPATTYPEHGAGPRTAEEGAEDAGR